MSIPPPIPLPPPLCVAVGGALLTLGANATACRRQAIKVIPFGAVLGYAPGGVAAYSCDYNTSVSCPPNCAYSSGVSYRHQANGLYYGIKFQCVEFSRV
jgi:hypothetical protein